MITMKSGKYILLAGAVVLAGCSSINSMLEGDTVDYKSAGKATKATLEIPPDLVRPTGDDRYTVPEGSRGSATLSGYNTTRQDPAVRSSVLPEVKQVRIERAGSQRWLVVNRPPEELWPVVREFWQQAGFLIDLDSPQTGIMETDWAENRAKIPQDFIRSTLGKFIDSLYSTSERDKFRTRLENSDKGTEIFISHRGVEEVHSDRVTKEKTIWQPRPPDPELEAEFLRRLMLALGVEAERAKEQLAVAAPPDHAKLVREGKNVVGLQVKEGFDRAWRRVGLALDRVGFTVEDRDRSQGVYYVRYVDPGIDNKTPEKEKGLLGKLFTFSKKPEQPVQYRISVKDGGTDQANISVQTKDGQPERSETGARILALLHEQLK